MRLQGPGRVSLYDGNLQPPRARNQRNGGTWTSLAVCPALALDDPLSDHKSKRPGHELDVLNKNVRDQIAEMIHENHLAYDAIPIPPRRVDR